MERNEEDLARRALNQKNYVKRNPLQAKLTEMRKEQKIREKRLEEPDFDAEVRKKAAEKKARQRQRIKSGMRDNELNPELQRNIKVEPEVENEENIEPDDNAGIFFPEYIEADENDVFQTQRRIKRKSGSQEENPKLPKAATRLETTPSPNRQKDKGEQLRRKNREEKNREIDDLRNKFEESGKLIQEKNNKIQELEADLEKLINKNRVLETTVEESDETLLLLYKYMPTDGKRHMRDAFHVASPEMKRGTVSRLRRTTGLNFSNPPQNHEQEKSETKIIIEEFAHENTIEVPDTKQIKKGIRYRTASKLCLFECFDSQSPNMCTYQTFCKYWPQKYIKPKPSDLGTCMCIVCQNMELKTHALKSHIGAHHSLDTIIENARTGDFEAENKFKADLENIVEEGTKTVVGYLRWEKVKQTETNKNTGRAKSDKMMKMSRTESADILAESLMEEYETYKFHLEKHSTIYREVKSEKLEAGDSEHLAVIHMDWAEQHKISEIKEVQSAYFNGRFYYEIHTLYIYTKEDSHGAASLSDVSDHKAEAIHAAIKHEIIKLKEKGKTKIVVVSDSPTSQYRNAKNVYLMKRLATELGICIRLLFTESGHGKSPCDGVGGNIKKQVEEVLLRNYGENNLK